MPLYDYQCKQCQQVTEVRHGVGDVHAQPCPACGGELSRVFNPAGIVFKGSGFYVTDSRKKSGGDAAAPSAGSESKKPESKTPESTPKKSDAA